MRSVMLADTSHCCSLLLSPKIVTATKWQNQCWSHPWTQTVHFFLAWSNRPGALTAQALPGQVLGLHCSSLQGCPYQKASHLFTPFMWAELKGRSHLTGKGYIWSCRFVIPAFGNLSQIPIVILLSLPPSCQGSAGITGAWILRMGGKFPDLYSKCFHSLSHIFSLWWMFRCSISH